MKLSTLALGAIFPLLALASNVIDLDDTNFSKYVGGSKGALVEFYAPWCGHCKNLAPVFESLGDAFAGANVVIAKTDADGVGKKLGKKYGVKGYPTLKWFPPNSDRPVDYSSGRDLDSLVKFVTENAGVKSKIKPPAPPATLELAANNHDSVALDDSKDVLVAYTAPWCGHCKTLKPVLEQVAVDFKNEPNCVVALMDADEEQNKPIASRYGGHANSHTKSSGSIKTQSSCRGLKFFPKNSSKSIDFTPSDYQLGRSEDIFVKFLNQQCGTHRSPGGGALTDLAGRVLGLDELVGGWFLNPVQHSTEGIVEKAKAVVAGLSGNAILASSGEYYLKVVNRLIEKKNDGNAWLTKEQARLTKLLSSSTVAPQKVDEIKVKLNILSSFLSDKIPTSIPEAVEVASDAAQAVANQAGSVANAATEAAGNAASQASQVVGDATAQATQVVGDAAAQASSAVGGAASQASSVVGGAASQASEAVGGAAAHATQAAGETYEAVVEKGQVVYENAKESVEGAGEQVRKAVHGDEL